MRAFILTLFFDCGAEALRKRAAASLADHGCRVVTNGSEGRFLVPGKGDLGTVFDLRIGDTADTPQDIIIENRFGIDDASIARCSSIEVRLAEYPDDGDPVEFLRGMTDIVLALLDDDAVAVWWSGANSLMSASYFAKSAGIWLADGAFPALGFAALSRDQKGVMHSVGLSLLARQEIAVQPGGSLTDAASQARLAIRVIDFLVREGALTESQTLEVDGLGLVQFEVDQNKGVINLYS